ncbi:MAG: hypothetical protein PHW00_00820 [Clostridia bacterium]|nr:hypothetical protein [Clostridia bacterium]
MNKYSNEVNQAIDQLYNLGLRYCYINPRQKNREISIICLDKCAQLQHEDSYYVLGNIYYNGFRANRNSLKGEAYYTIGARLGSNKCRYALSNMAGDAPVAKQLSNKVYIPILNEADNGDVISQYIVSMYKEKGLGDISVNLEDSFNYLTKSALGGYTPAQQRLGDYYRDGIATNKDVEKAKYWYKKAGVKYDGTEDELLFTAEEIEQFERNAQEQRRKLEEVIAKLKSKSKSNQLESDADYILDEVNKIIIGKSPSSRIIAKLPTQTRTYGNQQAVASKCRINGYFVRTGTKSKGKSYGNSQPVQPVQPIQPIQPIQPVPPTMPITVEQAHRQFTAVPNQPAQPTQPVQPAQPALPLEYAQLPPVIEYKDLEFVIEESDKQVVVKEEPLIIKQPIEDVSEDEIIKRQADKVRAVAVTGDGVDVNASPRVRALIKRAWASDAIAQYELALCYETGNGIDISYEKAIFWYDKSANADYFKAQSNLGIYFQKGIKVEKDIYVANRLYRLASTQGYAPAQYNLGVCYIERIGVKSSFLEAARQFMLAANQNYAPAQYYLGLLYEAGKGVEKNLDRAIQLFKHAQLNGMSGAQNKINRCLAEKAMQLR